MVDSDDVENVRSICGKRLRMGQVIVNDMGGLSWYVGCALEHDKVEGVVKKTQTAFVNSLVKRFDIQDKAEVLAYVVFDLGP